MHALKEIWRVLKSAGIVIDLRPISVDVPLLVLTDTGWKSAGLADQSPDRVHDIAADRAMRLIILDGLFIRVKQKYFDTNNYWDNIKKLKEDMESDWKDDVIISKGIWREARRLFKNGSGKKRIRVPFRKKITVYQKK